ncbi:hypothetical protein TWF225_002210 [Orbilia oligospora]|nr:hypothetical protein TWF225_002210 [Orbilia oligospora]KAF3257929.1 hypothetical protein TWF128_004838 [Orbilia oligospora]KAF3271047.1 hypothetical protein TWF217_005473 [Orbilia oligospora]KAF3286414.1 hypothetical protein TWF132_008981 [Orbilia oligospora]
MDSSFRSRSPSTTHGSYFHDSDQDAHDYTRLRLQQQLARDLDGSPASHKSDSTIGSLGISEGAAAMSTRKLDDILPQTPNLDSKFVNSQFKDFSTIGVAVRNRLFPGMSNNTEDSAEIGRGISEEHTRTDKSSTLGSIFARTAARTASNAIDNSGKLTVPTAGINAGPRRLSPNTRARMQPTVVDESMELSSYSIGSRLSGSRRPSRDVRSTKEQAAREKLQEAATIKENIPLRTASHGSLAQSGRVTSNTALLNTEKLFRDMGFSSDESDFSEIKPCDSPSLRKYHKRAASKPPVPSVTGNSIKLPDMTGISDLVSSIDHGNHISNRSQRAPIQQVPVPVDERELLVSLKKLQKKVAALEADKEKERKRAKELERNCEETRQLYQIEADGRRQLEAELNNRKRADSALGGEIDSQQGSPRQVAADLKAKHQAELKKLETVVSSYRNRIESVERKYTTMQQDLGLISQERDIASSSLARKTAQNDELQEEIESLRKENDELAQENDLLSGDVERLMRDLERKDKDLDHERKLMNDKINRYREKVARTSRIATESTLAANSYQAITRGWKSAVKQDATAEEYTATKANIAEIKKTEARKASVTNNAQPAKPAIKITREGEGQPLVASKPEERVQQQVDTELKKLFPSTSTAPATASAAAKRKISNSTTASRSSNKPHVKKTRTVVEEYSESETEEAAQNFLNVPFTAPTTGESSFIEAYLDDTFTEPSLSESRIHREMAGDVLDDDTNTSFVEVRSTVPPPPNSRRSNLVSRRFVQSEGVARLRREILEERKQLEAFTSQQRTAEKNPHFRTERTTRRNDDADVKVPEVKKRVQIFSEKDNDELDIEGNDEEVGHPFLRTSMIANDTEGEIADNEIGNILHELPRSLPSPPSSQQTVKRHVSAMSSIRAAEDYNDNAVERVCIHNAHSCTLCHRASALEECQAKGHIVNDSFDVEIPEVVPISRRMLDDSELAEGEVTIRPSQPPKYALDKVMKQIQDELEHLKLEYKQIEAEYLACDPSLGRRKRKSLTNQLTEIVELMDKKADQIYALYDVAEGVTADRASSVSRTSARRHSTGSRISGHIVV